MAIRCFPWRHNGRRLEMAIGHADRRIFAGLICETSNAISAPNIQLWHPSTRRYMWGFTSTDRHQHSPTGVSNPGPVEGGPVKVGRRPPVGATLTGPVTCHPDNGTGAGTCRLLIDLTLAKRTACGVHRSSALTTPLLRSQIFGIVEKSRSLDVCDRALTHAGGRTGLRPVVGPRNR